MARICLITPFHVSFQPRTIREADGLAAAGHSVRVVSCQSDGALVPADERLMRQRRWHLRSVDLRRRGSSSRAWLAANLWSRWNRLLFRGGVRCTPVAARAYVRGLGHMVRAAEEERADWYIAHTQAALPVAAAAAQRWQARLGFDCEDLLADSGTDPPALVRSLEHTYLPRCAYVSAPSRAIADELSARYDIAPPVVLHNVFPLRLAGDLIAPEGRSRPPRLRLHWLGQTIGPGRGLEEAIDAAGLLREPVELHFRGRIGADYRTALHRRAAQQKTPAQLTVHPLVDHDVFIRGMSAFDVGLCLERPEHGNFSKTVTNKLFSFLLAGLAIAATDTPGQEEVMAQIPGAGFVYRAGQVAALADGLSRWQGEPEALRRAQTAAWDAARARFCWDHEEPQLLRILELP